MYDLAIGNAARGRTEDKIEEVKVLSIGRKYFVCGESIASKWKQTKYDLETWREVSDYAPDHCLYESLQERADEREKFGILDDLKATFGGWGRRGNLTLDQLRRIKAIIEESKP